MCNANDVWYTYLDGFSRHLKVLTGNQLVYNPEKNAELLNIEKGYPPRHEHFCEVVSQK